MLNIALQEQLDIMRGLRPEAEITNLILQSMEIKTANPSDYYKLIKKIKQDGYGDIFLVSRIRDSKLFAMKQIKNTEPREVAKVIREASLIHYLNYNCNELVGCEELYHYKKSVYILLEYMN